MEFQEVVRSRRTIRSFLDKDVSEDAVRQIIEAGILAPSPGNIQPWEFIIIRDKATKHKLVQETLGQMHVFEAPVVIVVCTNLKRAEKEYGSRGRELYCIQASACSAMIMLLTTVCLGLGAAWVGSFKERSVKEILELPEDIRPVAIVPIGHPAELSQMPKRRNYKDVVHYEKW